MFFWTAALETGDSSDLFVTYVRPRLYPSKATYLSPNGNFPVYLNLPEHRRRLRRALESLGDAFDEAAKESAHGWRGYRPPGFAPRAGPWLDTKEVGEWVFGLWKLSGGDPRIGGWEMPEEEPREQVRL